MIGLGAMALVIVSTFLPLIKYAGMDSPSVWGAGENGQTVGIIVLVVSLLVGLFSFLANKTRFGFLTLRAFQICI